MAAGALAGFHLAAGALRLEGLGNVCSTFWVIWLTQKCALGSQRDRGREREGGREGGKTEGGREGEGGESEGGGEL